MEAGNALSHALTVHAQGRDVFVDHHSSLTGQRGIISSFAPSKRAFTQRSCLSIVELRQRHRIFIFTRAVSIPTPPPQVLEDARSEARARREKMSDDSRRFNDSMKHKVAMAIAERRREALSGEIAPVINTEPDMPNATVSLAP